MGYEHLDVERQDHVGWLWLNRPDKRNALSPDMWADIPQAVNELAADASVRVIVVAGRGPSFTVGIDIGMLASLAPSAASDAAAKASLHREIRRLQSTMTALAESPKPVIAAIHGHCLGAGVDLVTACDIRLATGDAVFSVRETKLGIVADVGTLQRLPRLIAPGHVAELVYTGGDFDADFAHRTGLVNGVYGDVGELHEAAATLAQAIAANSPLAVEGSKAVLRAGEDMTTAQALDHVALWNAAFLQSNDLGEALTAFAEKRSPRFTGT